MKVAIVGVTGYSGLELVRLLAGHSQAQVASVHATKDVGQKLSALYPHLAGICDLELQAFQALNIIQNTDLVFFATPSGVAKEDSEIFVEHDFPMIDLSGDHRLSAPSYEKWYGKQAAKPAVLDKFTYSLAEFADGHSGKFIANPGCYATATELALIPLMNWGKVDLDSIIVDAKSGLTGAGKKLAESSHFVNVHDNYMTYKINKHQHIPEIAQELKKFNPNFQHLQFSTSLLPINRGIMATAYIKMTEDVSQEEVYRRYQDFYDDKPFVRLQGNLPNLHDVLGSNYTDIGFAYNPITKVLTVVSVLDNLVKGAAGQAIQNMNIAFGFAETDGLLSGPSYL
ncbi:N-acetyl-gamma-glutamyl-phosphate reductase [Streptococcus tangpeifui]|uniref:N-acetyl-gamma-glutamyl-phosphate reductase n=1 Tax=Streptococcus tangpeifui TaxID=2709400 RepID=UPI0013EB3B8E|nr:MULTISPECIES: N-acetyl-gamma-glutamyl-phosphate reductase [unclassified Streptococcus]